MSYTFRQKGNDVAPDTASSSRIIDFWEVLRTAPPMAHLTAGLTVALWAFLGLYGGENAKHVASNILDGVFSGIIAGYIFFILFALLPEYQMKAKIGPFINSQIGRIVDNANAIIGELNRASGVIIDFDNLKLDKVAEATSFDCNMNRPRMQIISGSNRRAATWYEYFHNQNIGTKNIISIIFNQSRYIEVELAVILAQLDNDPFFDLVRASIEFSGIISEHQKFENWAKEIYEYFVRCKSLQLQQKNTSREHRE